MSIFFVNMRIKKSLAGDYSNEMKKLITLTRVTLHFLINVNDPSRKKGPFEPQIAY